MTMFRLTKLVTMAVSPPATYTMCVTTANQIYSVTDPISLRLSATVDAEYARLMSPVTLLRNPLEMQVALEQPRLSIKHWLEKHVREEEENNSEGTLPKVPRKEAMEHSERKLKALNPYGTLDFSLETNRVNQFTQYLDMLQAHMCYWTSVPMANFLLKQLVPRESE